VTERVRLTLIFAVVGVIGGAYWWRSTKSPTAAASVIQQEAPADSSTTSGRRGAVEDMKDALRNLAVAQEAYYSEHNRYAASIEELQQGGVGYYRATSGVTIVIEGTTAGWSAVASSTVTDTTCVMAMPPAGPEGGAPRCGPPSPTTSPPSAATRRLTIDPRLG